MAAEAEATREASAKVCKNTHTTLQKSRLIFFLHQIISAKGELDSSRALKEAADMISTPTALQLRYLQTLNTIAAERGSTIMFPIPMEIMGQVSDTHTHTHAPSTHVLAAGFIFLRTVCTHR